MRFRIVSALLLGWITIGCAWSAGLTLEILEKDKPATAPKALSFSYKDQALASIDAVKFVPEFPQSHPDWVACRVSWTKVKGATTVALKSRKEWNKPVFTFRSDSATPDDVVDAYLVPAAGVTQSPQAEQTAAADVKAQAPADSATLAQISRRLDAVLADQQALGRRISGALGLFLICLGAAAAYFIAQRRVRVRPVPAPPRAGRNLERPTQLHLGADPTVGLKRSRVGFAGRIESHFRSTRPCSSSWAAAGQGPTVARAQPRREQKTIRPGFSRTKNRNPQCNGGG